MKIIGHTLVWHSQTPRWVFQGDDGNPPTREVMLERMRDHIFTVAGRYKGRIHGWDVVNEALNDDGTLRQSPWLRVIGEDYLMKAFHFAHEADPSAELYYNDYSLHRPDKRAGAVKLIKMLLKYREKVTRVTFWGVTDRSSWLNNFPIRGRTDYPLLFGRDRQPKPAFWSVVNLRSPNSNPEE